MVSPQHSEFFDACRRGDKNVVQQLYEQNPDIINATDAKGFTPLIIAVYNNQLDVTDFLLQHGAKEDMQDMSGNTALMGVCYRGYKEIAAKLIASGADINQRNFQGATALTFAATFGQYEIAEMLLKHGADVTVRDVRGKSPIDHAVIQENLPMVQLLEQYL